jgi:sigma-B regulation protein RsbU (phosphoserine phosphatase)
MDPKQFHRRLEALLDRASGPGGVKAFAERLMPSLLEEFGPALGISYAKLYRLRDGNPAHVKSWGASPNVERTLGALFKNAENEQLVPELPWADRTPEGTLALLPLGSDGWMMALGFDGGNADMNAASALALVSPIAHAASQRLRRKELEDLLEQARAIQMSLLPPTPAFGDFDIAAVSVPARVVGGDVYDMQVLDTDTLAISVADASGHGLPAALQARDVVTGLRMGAERDLKITRVIERLNRVIYQSGLTSRFVSLVFGELELNGTLTYINAGHPPPLLLADDGLHELSIGGGLLGPQPDALYKRGFAHVDRGAALLLYTDGALERGTTGGDPFGPERLAAWLSEWRDGPAQQALEDLVTRLKVHGEGEPFEDDITLVFVRRPRST